MFGKLFTTYGDSKPSAMPFISKERDVQHQLACMYDNLERNVENMKKELKSHRNWYEDACHMHIKSGFQLEKLWLKADENYQNKFREFETHCFLLDVFSDFRDEEGNFLHLHEFFLTLDSLIDRFTQQEAYEICAILLKWKLRFKNQYNECPDTKS